MFIGAICGVISAFLVNLLGLTPAIVEGAHQLGIHLDGAHLQGIGAFVGFIGGAFRATFTASNS